MGMPKRLVQVRHGKSDGNVIQNKISAGVLNSFPNEYPTFINLQLSFK